MNITKETLIDLQQDGMLSIKGLNYLVSKLRGELLDNELCDKKADKLLETGEEPRKKRYSQNDCKCGMPKEKEAKVCRECYKKGYS